MQQAPQSEGQGLRRAVDDCPVGIGGGWVRTLMDIAEGNLEEARRSIEFSENRVGGDDTDVIFVRSRLHEATKNND